MELKLPNQYCTDGLQIARNGDFAQAYDQAVQDALAEATQRLAQDAADPDRQAEAVCDAVRIRVDQAMMDYLVAHDGEVDSWPALRDPAHTFTVGDTTYRFVYFAVDPEKVDAEAARPTKRGRRAPKLQLPFVDTYRFEATEACRQAQVWNTRRSPSVWKNLMARIRLWVCRLPWVVTVLTAVLCLMTLLGGDVEALFRQVFGVLDGDLPPVAVIALVPLLPVIAVLGLAKLLCTLLTGGADANLMGSVIGVVFGLGVLTVVSVIASPLLRSRLKPVPIPWLDLFRQRAAMRAFKKGGYDEVMARGEAYEQASREWHRAWFAHCRAQDTNDTHGILAAQLYDVLIGQKADLNDQKSEKPC